MNAPSKLALLSAVRRVVAKHNPDLLSWSSHAWNGWVRSQRNPELPSGTRLVVAAEVTCLEDLPLQVGLMQLLAVHGVSCSVVLAFPTEEMVRLAGARSRREEWHELVRLITTPELPGTIDRLSGDSLVVAFSVPAVLGRQELGRISALLSGVSDRVEASSSQTSELFVGRATDYPGWGETERPTQAEVGLALATQNPTRIAVSRGVPFPPSVGQAAQSGIPCRVEAFEGGLAMPALRNGGDFLLTALHDAEECAVVVRQRGDLLDPDRPMQVRMPARMLTVTPQKIRAECRRDGREIASREFLFHVPPSRLKSWMMSAFLNRGGGGNPAIRAFAQAIRCRIAYAEDEPDELQDLPIVWGVLRQSDRILAQAKRQSFYFFYMDHAYFNRGHGKAYRITRNGYEAGPIRDCPPDRVSTLGIGIEPWRKSGREIIVCPPTDYFMQAHGCPDWLDETLATLRGVTDRPIVVRMKPQPGQQATPLPQAIKKAHALVTHSSNVAIEAACLGTPVFVDAASAAAPVGLTDLARIEAPVYPDRDPWLAHLAYNQFSFEEIQTGRAWQLLLELEERDYV